MDLTNATNDNLTNVTNDEQLTYSQLDDQLKKNKEQIVSLFGVRNGLENSMRLFKERENNEKLREIDHHKELLNKKIDLLEKEIHASQTQIKDMQSEINQLQKNIKNLDKEKCPIIGHRWAYDIEQLDEGGPLEEYCTVCGSPRCD